MITGTYDKMTNLAGYNECAEHESPLTVVWYSSDAWALRCNEGNHFPETIRRLPSLTEEYKQGTLPDGPIADNIKKRRSKKTMSNQQPTEVQTIDSLPEVDIATREPLSVGATHSLIQYAQKYGLDAYRGHVVVYYGKPYVGLDGYLYHAHRSSKLWRLSSRPLAEDERKTYQIKEGDFAWVSEIILGTEGRSFIGLGIVTMDEMVGESKNKPGQLKAPVVAAHPQLLAQKRAEWQALRRAFPIEGVESKEAS